MGVAKDITDGGIFPLAPTDAPSFNEVSEILTLTEPISNYKSVEDARERERERVGMNCCEGRGRLSSPNLLATSNSSLTSLGKFA